MGLIVEKRVLRRSLVGMWAAAVAGVLAAVFATAGCAKQAVDATSIEARLKAAARASYESGAYAGLSVGVYKNGKPLFEGQWGKADIENAVPVDGDTVFYVGSITKPFTGLAINLLIDDGKLSLSDTVGKLLPTFKGPAAKVTLAQLLSQTSGIPDYVDAETVGSFRPYSRDDVLALFSGKPLEFTPGESWQYSNSNAYLMGLIIEAASGETYGDFIAKRVAGPLGIGPTQFADESRIIPHRASGYNLTPDGYLNAPKYDPLLPFSAGSLLSTPRGVAGFARAAYGVAEDDPVPASVRERLLTPVTLPGGLDCYYRLGSVALLDFGGHRKVSHAGLTSGFTSHFGYYPDDDVAVVVLANGAGISPHPAHIEAELARIALGMTPPPNTPQAADADFIAGFTGDYELAPVLFFGTDVFGLVVRDGALAFQFGPSNADAPAIPLVYIGNDVFISALDSEHVFSFKRDETGEVASLDLEFYAIPFSGRRQQ